MERRFTIVGAGLGTPDGLTGQARQALCEAGLVLSTPRLAEQLSPLCPVTACAVGQLAQRAIQADAAHVAVAVSGDTGFFSLTRTLAGQLAQAGTVTVLPGISSMQALCAALGTSYDDAYVVSLHGRAGDLTGAVSYHSKVFALTGGDRDVQTLCRELDAAGLGAVRVACGEALGSLQARVRTGTAHALAAQPCGSLAVLLIEHAQAVDPHRPLRDEAFTRGAAPMTKQEVRWIAVNLLDVAETDVVYDVGAGTGSVAIELARRASRGQVYAIEHKEEALALLAHNRVQLGAYNVVPVAGRAPEALSGLPAPDAVFIGGSGGELPAILHALRAANPAVRVCISAIALETLSLAQSALAQAGFDKPEVCQLSAARGRRVGPYTMMTANNPVFLLTAGGRP